MIQAWCYLARDAQPVRAWNVIGSCPALKESLLVRSNVLEVSAFRVTWQPYQKVHIQVLLYP